MVHHRENRQIDTMHILLKGSEGDMFKMELKHPFKNLPKDNILHRHNVMSRFMNLMTPTRNFKGEPKIDRSYHLEPHKVR